MPSASAKRRTAGSPAPQPGPSSASAQGILGIQPDFKGLRVDPCIPKSWPGFTVSRSFRGVEYQIAVKNPNGICKGVKKVVVDGKAIPGNVIPFEAGKKIVKVEITLEA